MKNMKLSLSEILQLDMSNSSVKKIDSFLASETEYSDPYMRALSYKALMLHKLGETELAVSIISKYIKEFKLLTPYAVIALSDSMIEISLDIENYENAYKFINLKKTFLPISKMNLYLKDMIKYLIKKGNIEEAKETLLKYLKDDISKDEALMAKEELANIYYSLGEYDNFIEITEGLLDIYQSKLDLDKEANLNIKLLNISFKKKNYIKVVSEVNKIIPNFDNPSSILQLATLAMKAYIELNDYKKASIFESNYEEYVNEAYQKESKDFLETAIELYNILNSRVSVRELESLLQSITKTKEEPKKKKKEEIVIPSFNINKTEVSNTEINNLKPYVNQLNPKEEEIKPKTEVRKQKVDIKYENVSSFYIKLSDLIDTLNQMNLNNKFREIFRLSMIEITKVFKIEEAYILDSSSSIKGMHYKKERVYDKKISINEINDTLNLAAFEGESEFFLDQSERKYNKNIITFEKYPDDYYGFAIPLYNDNDVIGSISYLSSEPFLADEMAYEGLKMITSILNSRLLLCLEKEKILLNNQKLYFLRENMSLGIKEEMEGYIHLSKNASKLLSLYEDLSLDDYYMHIPTNSLIEYKNIRNRLYNDLKEASLEYDFNKDNETIRIKESFYSLMVDGTISIISIIEDITKYDKEKNELIKLAYTNPISKLDTEIKLMVDLRDLYNSKRMALAILKVHDFSLYEELYGFNFKRQLELAIGNSLKEAIANDFYAKVYHLGEDLYAIAIKGANDKRLIDSKIKQFIEFASKDLHKLSNKLNILFDVGVYRLGKNSVLEDPSMILSYAYEALNDAIAMTDSVHHISHYDSEEMKNRFRENNLVTAISEAIDSNDLNLVYQQIVDIQNKKVFGYYTYINLDSSELFYDEIMKVVRRRNLEARVNQYEINQLFAELKTLYIKSKHLFPVFIEINEELIDRRTFEFLKERPQFYKISPSFVTLVVKTADNPYVNALRQLGYKICSMDILDIYRNNLDYFVYDYRTIGTTGADEISELCIKHNVLVIAGGIDIQEDIVKAQDNKFRLVFGRFYKRTRTMNELINKIMGNNKN